MYCYVVETYTTGYVANVRSSFVLGVHSSLKKAKSHFDAIINDRRGRENFYQRWVMGTSNRQYDKKSLEMKSTLLEYTFNENMIREMVFIQRWKIA